MNGDILIVEDERIIACDLQKDLENFGYRVSGIASNGRDAMTLAQKAMPDLVIMDINIKGNVDGVDLAKEMQNRFNISVLYITGCGDQATIDRVKETNPAGFLLKPFSQTEVRAAVELAMGKARGVPTKMTEKWFGCVLRSMREGIVVVDERGTIRHLNSSAEKMTGATVSTAIGKPLTSVLWLHPDDGLEIMTFARQGPAPRGGQVSAQHGNFTSVEFTVAPLESDGDQIGSVIVMRELPATIG